MIASSDLPSARDAADRLPAQVLQVEDAPLERRQVVLDHRLAQAQHAARVDGAVGRHVAPRQLEELGRLDRLEARARTPEAAVHRIARDPEDPDQQGRVALIAGETPEDGEEDLLLHLPLHQRGV